jgi:Hemerythrin HHE cation binding domain
MFASPGTVTLNAAFLKEIKHDHRRFRSLLRRLRLIFGSSQPHVGRLTIVRLLGKLRDELALRFTLEEAFGYFDDPLDAPHYWQHAKALLAQHRDLYEEECELAERSARLLSRRATCSCFRRLARDFRSFDYHLRQHEARENELILAASNCEIGVGD